MNSIKKGWENQALGLLPLLLFLVLDNCFTYLQSFLVSVVFCTLSMLIFHGLRKDKVYAFMLLPASLTFVLYSFFLIFMRIESVLVVYTPLIVEVLFVVVLILIRMTRKGLMRKIRNSEIPAYQRTNALTLLNEFFFIAQIAQNLYTLHLFAVILYSIIPETMQNVWWSRLLYRDLGVIIGVLVIVYEQIRLMMLQGRLRKEMWLPVLNDKGNVIGSIAYSVSRLLPKKYYHPIIRVALVYNGMLYLSKRNAYSCVSPSLLDYPFYRYVLFRQTIEAAVHQAIEKLRVQIKTIEPFPLIRYTFENEKVKHQVSLFIVRINDEKLLEPLKEKNGKLWSVRQIEENLPHGIFSEYFEKEFPYLKNTVLLAENFRLVND
ncbi:MAG TPA: hypothetical protein H9778_06085 [Candidatus Parabacteroides intestinavium]|nr:hypothetical protein [Candidatus Parabacteroides intestinavium]